MVILKIVYSWIIIVVVRYDIYYINVEEEKYIMNYCFWVVIFK